MLTTIASLQKVLTSMENVWSHFVIFSKSVLKMSTDEIFEKKNRYHRLTLEGLSWSDYKNQSKWFLIALKQNL